MNRLTLGDRKDNKTKEETQMAILKEKKELEVQPKKEVEVEKRFIAQNVPVKLKAMVVDKDTGESMEQAVVNEEILNKLDQIIRLIEG